MTNNSPRVRGAWLASAREWLFPGELGIWRAGAVFVAVGCLVLGWFALKPRDYLTGSTSTYTRSAVASLGKGSQLCLPRVTLPGETRRVQVDLGGSGPVQPPAEVEVTAAGGAITRTFVQGKGTPEFARVTAGVPDIGAWDTSGRQIPAELCIKALGDGLTVGGMVGVAPDRPVPTLDGKALGVRVSVWFLPAAGEKRSLLELFPQVSRRAALFRPAPFGAWTYWVIFGVAVPLMGWLSLRALAAPQSRQALVGVAVVGIVSAGSWALITSPFDAPDESEHFAALQYVAETGKQVDRAIGARGPYSTQQVNLLEALRHFSTIESADGKKPWLESQREYFSEQEARGPPRDNGGGATVTTSAGNTAYYVLIAPSYLLARGEGILAAVLAGRFTSALFLLVIAFCAFGTVRELFPSRNRLAIGAALLVVLSPVLSFLSGAINTDMGVNAADALLIYLVIRAMRRGATPLVMATIALVAVLAVLIKATAYALVPAVAVGVLVALWRAGRSGSWRSAIASLAGIAVGLGLGMAAKYSVATLLGKPSTGQGVPALGPPTAAAMKPGAVLSYAWQTFFPRLPGMADHWIQTWPFLDIYIKRGFGAFGWYAYELPRAVIVSIVAGVAGVLGCGAFTAFKRKDGVWKFRWEIAVLFLVIAGVLGGVAAAYYSDTPRPVPGEQGRYAFPTAVAVTTLAVGSLIGFRPQVRRWLLVGAVVAVGVVGVMGRLTYLAGAYS